MENLSSVATLAIIAVTVVVSLHGFNSTPFRERYLLNTEAILGRREYHRVLTSAFLHLDGLHLFLNMYTLFLFGDAVERYYGVHFLLVIYGAAVAGGGLLSLCIHRHHAYRALGASGGVSGVLLAYVFLFPGSSLQIFPVPFWIPAWLFAILYLLYTFYGMHSGRDNIGHDAHFGGAIAGLAAATALEPRIALDTPYIYAAVLAIAAAATAYVWKTRHGLPFAFDPPRALDRMLRKRREHRRRKDDMRLDTLLARVGKSGMESLSARERRFLLRMAQKRGHGAG